MYRASYEARSAIGKWWARLFGDDYINWATLHVNVEGRRTAIQAADEGVSVVATPYVSPAGIFVSGERDVALLNGTKQRLYQLPVYITGTQAALRDQVQGFVDVSTSAAASFTYGTRLVFFDDSPDERLHRARMSGIAGDTLLAFGAGGGKGQRSAELNQGLSRFLSSPSPRNGRTSVAANKAAGDAVRDVIGEREWPSMTENSETALGGVRRTDVVKIRQNYLEGIESKVGETDLTRPVRQELARDYWLRKSGVYDRIRWEFTPSEITGKVGPTPELAEKIEKLGFDIRINESAAEAWDADIPVSRGFTELSPGVYWDPSLPSWHGPAPLESQGSGDTPRTSGGGGGASLCAVQPKSRARRRLYGWHY